jgi:16S rRNA (guanine1207-N2)-methyltransferase
MSQYFENDDKVKHQIRRLEYAYGKYNIDFLSDNGVFAKNGVDFGSQLLMETFLDNHNSGKVLDVGGGIGVISIVLSKVSDCTCDMVEINPRAIDLAKENSKLNKVEDKVKVLMSNAYESVCETYDYVITNPPIRAGKKVVYTFLFEAFNYLRENGELWFVMRKNHGLESTMKDLKNKGIFCQIMEKDKGFFIVKAKKVRN